LRKNAKERGEFGIFDKGAQQNMKRHERSWKNSHEHFEKFTRAF
jgi:hypothetical protein